MPDGVRDRTAEPPTERIKQGEFQCAASRVAEHPPRVVPDRVESDTSDPVDGSFEAIDRPELTADIGIRNCLKGRLDRLAGHVGSGNALAEADGSVFECCPDNEVVATRPLV